MGKKNVLHFLLHCVYTAAIFAFIAIGYMSLSYWRDPLYLFHSPKSDHVYMNKVMRIQAAGMINTFEYDSVIMGTSILQNSSAAGMGKALGGRFVNLSMGGSSFWERSIVLRYAFKKKALKCVVYSLDRFYHECVESPGYPLKNWGYLYNDDRWDDLKVYITGTYFKDIVLGIHSGRKDRQDRPGEWMSRRDHFCRFGGLHNWIGNMDKQGMGDFLCKRLPKVAAKANPSAPIIRDTDKEKRAAAYLDKYVFSFAEQHPETRFFLIFPPYWRFDFAEMRQTNTSAFALHQQVVRYAVRRAEALGNVRVFGFEDCAFVDDIAHYKDVTHYDDSINEYMAESMGQGRHLLTSGNVEAYLDRCDDLARTFDIKALNSEVQQRLAERKK